MPILESAGWLFYGFQELMGPNMVFVLLGALLGLIIGVIPGVGGTTGVAILLPITVFFSPTAALVMLAGIYWGSMFGGVVTSILFGVPGNPWSVAVMFDGRPMAKMGKAGLALSAAFVVSFVSAILAAVLFTFFSIPFAGIALRFGPPELFAVLLIAFATFVGLGGESPFKALIMMAAGFLLAVVGIDVVSGQPRLTFGSLTLLQGFHFVPITIGLFGIGEVLYNASERYKLKIEEVSAAAKLSLQDVWAGFSAVRHKIGLTASSSLLGFATGLLPGVGATPASFMAYGVARQRSKNPEQFGHGAVEGVMAPEAANNSAGTASILPMMVLGIPGSPTAAILMAGIFMWGFVPGPRLFTDHPEFVWPFIASLYVANVAAFLLCISATPLLALILRTPFALLAPVIVMLSVLGGYAIQNSLFDVWLVLIFGVLGFVFRKLDYPLAPLVIALVLGNITEFSLRQTLIMGDGSLAIIFTRPIAGPLMAVALLLFLAPAWKLLLARLRRKRKEADEEVDLLRSPRQR
jgi:putative tricarboxylic transport membrane protein